MKMAKLNLTVDSESLRSAQELRIFSTSALVRYFLKLIVTDKNGWQKLIHEDPEIRQIHRYIRPKMLEAMGITDDQADKIVDFFGVGVGERKQ